MTLPYPMNGEPMGKIMSREDFKREMSAMPSGPEYGRVMDHDAELRAQNARLREALTKLLDGETRAHGGIIEQLRCRPERYFDTARAALDEAKG